jgi:tetratricopeptide (TPR) repeat protein
MDICLEFGGPGSVDATIYENLGRVVKQQRRFDEAEDAYRQALDIRLAQSDLQKACVTAAHLALLLAESGRHREAATVQLDSALLSRQAIGGWDPGDLRNLKRERAIIGQTAFNQLTAEKVPQELRASLAAGLDSAEDA